MEMDGGVVQQEMEKLRMSRIIIVSQQVLELETLQPTIAVSYKKTWFNRLQKLLAHLNP